MGANEAALNLFGENIASERGRAFALRVLSHMRAKIAEIQEETGDFYNLEATPAEGCSYRLARMDRDTPGMVFASGTREEAEAEGSEFVPYYTNSTHLPVGWTDDLFEALTLQDDLQSAYTGGTVLHAFLGEEVSDWTLVQALVRKITENYKLPYFTLTPTFSVCPNHGYLRGEQEACPICGSQADVYSRVVGYLRPVSRWNAGKQKEFSMRTEYCGSALSEAAGGVTREEAVREAGGAALG